MRDVTHLIVHCSGSDATTPESVRRFHMKVRGWIDAGYHVLIATDGTIHELRPETKQGAHVAGMNANTLAVCLVGDLDKRPPSPAQLTSLEVVLVGWCSEHDLDPLTAILGHRETTSFVPRLLATKKTCPGRKTDMTTIRAAVASRLKAYR